MSPAVQKGPLGDLHANGPSPREERVEGTPRRLTQGATARLGDLALLRSILLRMAKRVLARPVPPSARSLSALMSGRGGRAAPAVCGGGLLLQLERVIRSGVYVNAPLSSVPSSLPVASVMTKLSGFSTSTREGESDAMSELQLRNAR